LFEKHVAAAGLLHFAKGHDCVISRGENAITERSPSHTNPNEGRRVRLALY
jgi:hypothetical protein